MLAPKPKNYVKGRQQENKCEIDSVPSSRWRVAIESIIEISCVQQASQRIADSHVVWRSRRWRTAWVIVKAIRQDRDNVLEIRIRSGIGDEGNTDIRLGEQLVLE